MTTKTAKTKSSSSPLLSSNVQFIAGFMIPTIVLLYFSDESRLGPLWAMLVALAFPMALELYSLRVRRKPSLISVMAIIGILFVGLISVLGLSEGWLAVRRSLIYLVVAVVLAVLLRFKWDIVQKGLGYVLDMEAIHRAAIKKGTSSQISRHIRKTGYALSVFLLIIGIVTYVTTVIFITAPTGTSEFNAQYAQLRVLGVLFTTLPLLIGIVGLFVYLTSRLEKLTGIKTEEILKKKH